MSRLLPTAMVALAVAAVVLPSVAANHADTEPNDTCLTPSAWTAGSWSDQSSGSLSSTSTQDWSKVAVYRTERLFASTTSGGATDKDLEVYDPSCALRAASRTVGTSEESLALFADATGEWRLRTFCVCTATETYSIGYALSSNDAALGEDAGDTVASATFLTPGTYQAVLDTRAGATDVDWWRIDVPVGTQMSVHLTPDCSNNFDLGLYKADGTTRISESMRMGCLAETVTCSTGFLPATVYARAMVLSGAGAYEVSVTFDQLPLTSWAVPPSPLCT